jgi:hypothetical protein
MKLCLIDDKTPPKTNLPCRNLHFQKGEEENVWLVYETLQPALQLCLIDDKTPSSNLVINLIFIIDRQSHGFRWRTFGFGIGDARSRTATMRYRRQNSGEKTGGRQIEFGNVGLNADIDSVDI